jgi:hypothetical protein
MPFILSSGGPNSRYEYGIYHTNRPICSVCEEDVGMKHKYDCPRVGRVKLCDVLNAKDFPSCPDVEGE